MRDHTVRDFFLVLFLVLGLFTSLLMSNLAAHRIEDQEAQIALLEEEIEEREKERRKCGCLTLDEVMSALTRPTPQTESR